MTQRGVLPSVRSAMPVTISSAALRQMSEAERARVLDSAFDGTDEALANYLAVVDARLREFEKRYELPSSGLAAALESGQLRDTADLSEWHFWASVRDELARKAAV